MQNLVVKSAVGSVDESKLAFFPLFVISLFCEGKKESNLKKLQLLISLGRSKSIAHSQIYKLSTWSGQALELRKHKIQTFELTNSSHESLFLFYFSSS